MLVLTRGTNESIMIGDLVELMVVEIRGDRVRLGIKAPVDIPIYRKEVYDAIRMENIEAARVPVKDLREIEKLLGEGVVREDETGPGGPGRPNIEDQNPPKR